MATLRRIVRTATESTLPLFSVGAHIFPLDTKRLLLSDGTQYRKIADYLAYTTDQNYTPTNSNGEAKAWTLIYAFAPGATRTIDLTQGLFHEGAAVVVRNTHASNSIIVVLSGSDSRYVGPGEVFDVRYLGGAWVGRSTDLQPGMIIPFAGSTAPVGTIFCTGALLSTTVYARLYAALGTTWGSGSGTFGIPDQAEASLVGIGTRGSGVTSHDAFTLAQFKDDQFQEHTHRQSFRGGGYTPGTSSIGGASDVGDSTNDTFIQAPVAYGSGGTPRVGAVTRGKLLGVNFAIKY